MTEPKTLFWNKTKKIIYLVTSFDKYFKYYKKLFTNAKYLHDTNIELFRVNVKYVTYTTQLEAKLIFLKNSEYDQEPQSQTADNPVAPRGRAAQPSRDTQEDKLSKAISSLFPIKMIAILEWTWSNVQQNIEQLLTPTMGVTINKKSTTTEPPP